MEEIFNTLPASLPGNLTPLVSHAVPRSPPPGHARLSGTAFVLNINMLGNRLVDPVTSIFEPPSTRTEDTQYSTLRLTLGAILRSLTQRNARPSAIVGFRHFGGQGRRSLSQSHTKTTS